MLENFREKLQLVQQDVSSSFKTLGDMSRDGKVKRRSRTEERVPHLSAGLGLLSRYEDTWFLLHRRTKDCAEAAEAVDGDVVMLSAHWERRRAGLTQLQEQLGRLPHLTGEFHAITASIAHLEGEFEELESRLVHLETLCCQCEQLSFKKQQLEQLEAYRQRRRKEAESLEEELKVEHAQRVVQLELALQQKLRDRQKVYEDAFNQDVQLYLSTGQLHRGSAGGDLCSLDQVTLTCTSDQEALDDFLNSSGNQASAASSLTSGPDPDSASSESLNQEPPAGGQEFPPARRRDEAGSEDGEDLRVQSDEEDVQVDTSLVGPRDDASDDGEWACPRPGDAR